MDRLRDQHRMSRRVSTELQQHLDAARRQVKDLTDADATSTSRSPAPSPRSRTSHESLEQVKSLETQLLDAKGQCIQTAADIQRLGAGLAVMEEGLDKDVTRMENTFARLEHALLLANRRDERVDDRDKQIAQLKEDLAGADDRANLLTEAMEQDIDLHTQLVASHR